MYKICKFKIGSGKGIACFMFPLYIFVGTGIAFFVANPWLLSYLWSILVVVVPSSCK
jgi:hypothetical protein